MQKILKMIALSLLALELGILDWLAWFDWHIPFGWDADNLEVNSMLIPWHLLIRLIITIGTAILFWYFRQHCVTVHREESTKIITKG